MYSPREIYTFLTSDDLRSVIGKSFFKRHMESDDIKSPFDTPGEIYMLEHLIASGYIIAEYRNDKANDSESYLISTMGHAWIKNYKQSLVFRLKAYLHYFKHLHWVLFGSMMGSLLASIIWRAFVE
jgi:hypothetical protein